LVCRVRRDNQKDNKESRKKLEASIVNDRFQNRQANQRKVHKQARPTNKEIRVEHLIRYKINITVRVNWKQMVINQQKAPRSALKQDQEQILLLHPKELRHQVHDRGAKANFPQRRNYLAACDLENPNRRLFV